MSDPVRSHIRGRGRSRGGLGKHLRARGRSRGRGADFGGRLVLEPDEKADLDEEDLEALRVKYASRVLTSNVDRYNEPEPDPDESHEPDVDLTEFLQQQRDRDDSNSLGVVSHLGFTELATVSPDDKEVDHDLEQLIINSRLPSASNKVRTVDRKGKQRVLEWNDELETMKRDKQAAEAMRDLKTRLQGSSKLKTPTSQVLQRQTKLDDNRAQKLDSNEAFLDNLLD